jgi:hypothetical protein
MVQIQLYLNDKFQEGLFLSQYNQECQKNSRIIYCLGLDGFNQYQLLIDDIWLLLLGKIEVNLFLKN